MHGILGSQTNKKIVKQLASSYVGYPRPIVGVEVVHHVISPNSNTGPDPNPASIIDLLGSQITSVTSAIAMMQRRQQILQYAITSCEDLKADLGVEEPKKKPGKAVVDDRACGWVESLIWDDRLVEEYDRTERAENGIDDGAMACLTLRKRCDRHGGCVKA
jgi:hypothetical protein